MLCADRPAPAYGYLYSVGAGYDALPMRSTRVSKVSFNGDRETTGTFAKPQRKPHNPLAYLISLVLRHFEEVADNIQGLLPVMFEQAGFISVEAVMHFMTVAGTLTLYKAQKPR